MDEKKDGKELLEAIYKNALIGLDSLKDITPETDDEEMKAELDRERDEYETFAEKIAGYMKKMDMDLPNVNPIKKTMMKAGIKMDAMKDDSRSHLAEMMVKGTVMGITELGSLISANKGADKEIIDFAEELKVIQERAEVRLKALL